MPVPWVYVLGFLLGVGLQALVPVRVHSPGAVTALGVCGGIVFLPLVLAYVNWSVIPVEEASLNGVQGYDDYRAKVRRWI